jgi:hypothetical protein
LIQLVLSTDTTSKISTICDSIRLPAALNSFSFSWIMLVFLFVFLEIYVSQVYFSSTFWHFLCYRLVNLSSVSSPCSNLHDSTIPRERKLFFLLLPDIIIGICILSIILQMSGSYLPSGIFLLNVCIMQITYCFPLWFLMKSLLWEGYSFRTSLRSTKINCLCLSSSHCGSFILSLDIIRFFGSFINFNMNFSILLTLVCCIHPAFYWINSSLCYVPV